MFLVCEQARKGERRDVVEGLLALPREEDVQIDAIIFALLVLFEYGVLGPFQHAMKRRSSATDQMKLANSVKLPDIPVLLLF